MKRAKRLSMARNEKKQSKAAQSLGSEMGLVVSSDEDDEIPEGTPPATKSPKTPKPAKAEAKVLFATTCGFAGTRPFEEVDQGPPQKCVSFYL